MRLALPFRGHRYCFQLTPPIYEHGRPAIMPYGTYYFSDGAIFFAGATPRDDLGFLLLRYDAFPSTISRFYHSPRASSHAAGRHAAKMHRIHRHRPR